MRRKKILTACFLAAFAAIGAGYAFSLGLAEMRFDSTLRSYGTLTGEEAVDAIEELSGAFDEAELRGYGSRELGQIISASSRAAAAVGYLRQGEMRDSGVYAFLKACEKAALDRLAGESDTDHLDRLSVFAGRISELQADFSASDASWESLWNIFFCPEFETLMHELGMADFASESDFRWVNGPDTAENEAKRIAEKYLGKNYALKVSESELAYTVYASNIFAVISKKGGYLMQLMFDLPEQEVILSEDEARAVMLKFLGETVSDADILECESLRLDGIYRGEFYPVRNGVLCLDEGISVGVSAGSGRACLLDAGNYYRSRGGGVTLPEGAMTADDAARMWESEAATPCKVRRGGGVETVCYRVGDLFVDSVSGKRLDDVQIG